MKSSSDSDNEEKMTPDIEEVTTKWPLGAFVKKHAKFALDPLKKAKFAFRQPDPDKDEVDENRMFQKWKAFPGEEDEDLIYFQGEYNSENHKWHGRCMIIKPKDYVQMGEFINGKAEGKFMIIDKETTTTGKMNKGKVEGKTTSVFHSGEREDVITKWKEGKEIR